MNIDIIEYMYMIEVKYIILYENFLKQYFLIKNIERLYVLENHTVLLFRIQTVYITTN